MICDLENEIIYMNPAAVHNYEKWGGDKLIGRGLMNKESQKLVEHLNRCYSKHVHTRSNDEAEIARLQELIAQK